MDDASEEMMDDVTEETSRSEEVADNGGGGGLSLDADAILDTLVPRSINWRDTVRRHPLASVGAVGLVGYLVGRTKGATIMAGVTTGLSAAMMRQLSDVFDGDFFDF